MDAKAATQRYTRALILFTVAPNALMAILLVALVLGAVSGLVVAVAIVAIVVYSAATSRVLRAREREMMAALPTRETGTPFDRNAPSVTRAERERYERAQEVLGGHRWTILSSCFLLLMALWLAGADALSGGVNLVLMFSMVGLAVGFACQFGGWALQLTDKRVDEAGQQPRWWPRVSAIQRVAFRALPLLMVVLCVVAILVVPFPGVLLPLGFASGWVGTRWLLARLSARLDPSPN